MAMRRLQTRFILAGCLLVLATVASGVWSALTFARLSAVVDDALRANQKTIDESSNLAGALEREDDALLLALSNRERGLQELAAQRLEADKRADELLATLASDDGKKELAVVLRKQIAAYRAASAILLSRADQPGALADYHAHVNPLLRQAVAACAAIREESIQKMQQASVQARDQSLRATGIVAAICLAAVGLATVVAVWLGRSVVLPIRQLTGSVEAVRQGDFDQRLALTSTDELGELAAGFNRMAQTLGDYRRSSLGELLAAKSTLEATLNALPDAVFVFAPEGTLAALNQPAQALLQAWGAAGAQGVQDLPLRPEQRLAVDANLAGRGHVASRTDFGLALQVVLAGRPRRFLPTVVPIPEFLPKQTGAVLVLADVTEFARLDELRSELIGVASHELKTPLTTLHMNLLLLGEQADNLAPRQREMLAAALQGCAELGSTIDELLDVTRIEAGQLRLQLAPVDLPPLLNQVLQSLQARFEDAGVRTELVQEGAPTSVHGDAARLRTVFINLLTNALKYSPPGGTVTIGIAPGASGTVQVSVTDAGPGIPVELRERVFEKFFRVEHHQDNQTTQVRGTGIGLYLCRQIITTHGGSIWCEAGETGGARFRLTLPCHVD
jgi:NtrC-family two-component system sensor histidine kinase KinB